MSKATQNDARANAKGMATQAQTELKPIADQAGVNATDSRNRANSSLDTAGSTLAGAGGTLRDTAMPTLDSAKTSFGKMASTGGFTPEQEGAYLNRATEGADASSEALQNQVHLQQARTGQGDNGGATARIARQLGQVKAQSLNDAQVSLNEARNKNTIAGSAGLADVGKAQVSASGQEESIGRGQAAIGQVQAGMGNQSAQQQMAALGLQFNTEAEAQDALTKMSGNKGPWDNTLDLMRVLKPSGGAGGGN